MSNVCSFGTFAMNGTIALKLRDLIESGDQNAIDSFIVENVKAYPSEILDLKNLIIDTLNDPILRLFLPQGIINHYNSDEIDKLLSGNINNSNINPFSDSLELEILYLDTYFLTDTYGKSQYIRKTKQDLIFTFLLNKNTKTLVGSNEVNESIRNYLSKLFKLLLNYILKYRPELYNLIKDLELYKKGEIPNEVAFKFFSIIDDVFKNNNTFNNSITSKIGSIYEDDLAQALSAYITLRHFDEFIVENFKDILKISDSYKGEKYTFANKFLLNIKAKNIQTWRDDDKDYDNLEEIGNINYILLSIYPCYNYASGNSELTNELYSMQHFAFAKKSFDDLYYNSTFQNTKLFPIDDYTLYGEIILDLKFKYSSIFGEDRVTELIEYLKNYNISDALALINENTIEYAPIVLSVLLHRNLHSNLFSGENMTKIANSLMSLYTNIFNPKNEDALINYSIGNTSGSYYNYICQSLLTLLKSSLHRYTFKRDQGIVVEELDEGKVDQRFYDLRRDIHSRNSAFSNEKKYYKVDTHFDGDNKFIKIFWKLNNIDYCLVLVVFNENGIYKTYLEKGSTETNTTVPVQSFNSDECWVLIRDVLGIVSKDEFNKILELKHLNTGALVNLASSIILRTEISKACSSATTKGFQENLDKFYSKSASPQLTRKEPGSLIELTPTTNKQYPTLLRLSKDLSVIRLDAPNVTNNDSSGKLIGASLLASARGRFTTQILMRSENDPSLDFIHPNVYKGDTMIRDISTPIGIKSAVKLNAKELYTANFLYDFYAARRYYDYLTGTFKNYDGDLKDNAEIRLMGMIISDKSNLEKIRIGMNRIILFKNNETGEIIFEKPLIELNLDELRLLILDQITNYYGNLYHLMQLELLKLTPFLPFTITTNFYSNWNEYLESLIPITNKADIKKRKSFHDNLLHEVILKALKAGIQIEISENLFGNWSKDTGTFELNNVLIQTINRDWNKWFLDTNDQLLTDLIQLDVNLDVSGNNPVLDEAKKIHKNLKFLAHNDSKIAYCKIKGGKFDKSISSKLDLRNWTPYNRILEVLENDDNFKIDYNVFELFGIDTKLSYEEQKSKLLQLLDIDDASFKLNNVINLVNYLYPSIDKYNNSLKILKSIDSNLISSIENLGLVDIDTLISNRKSFLSQFNYSPELLEVKLNTYIKNLNDPSFLQKESFNFNYHLLKNLIQLRLTKGEEALLDLLVPENILDLIDTVLKDLDLNYLNDTQILYSIEINPELELHVLLDLLLSLEHIILMVGSHVNHPGNTENAKVGALGKRNVSVTALKLIFDSAIIEGIRKAIKIAVIDDLGQLVYNTLGVVDNQLTYDGATITCGTLSIHENNALGSAKAGINKKPFFHGINKYGLGYIIKTAGFDCNNDMIRRSPIFYRMNQYMLKHEWDTQLDITKDYNGNLIEYCSETNPIYYWKNGLYYEVIGIQSLGNNKYVRIEHPISKNLQINQGELKASEEFTITNNFDLWNFFGGQFSAHLENGELTFVNDNTSMLLLAKALNFVGVKNINPITEKPYEKVTSLHEVDLVLKRSMITYLVGSGAMKLGAANINKPEIITNLDPSYEMTYMDLKLDDVGILLDAEHHSEDSVLSLMTLVVNALSARGYSQESAQKVYKALNLLTRLSLEDAFDGLELGLTTNDYSKFKEAISNIIVDILKHSSSTDGNVLLSIANEIKKSIKDKSNIYSSILGKLPISNPAIYDLLITQINSALSKSAIKLKPPGVMCVLVPSDGMIKIYDDDLLDYQYEKYGTTDTTTIIDNIRKNCIENGVPVLKHEINLESSYFIINLDGQYIDLDNNIINDSVRIKSPLEYYKLRNLNNITLIEDKSKGRDLAASRITFKANNENFCIWDLDSIKCRYWLEHEYTAHNLDISNILTNYNYPGQTLMPETDLEEWFNDVRKFLLNIHLAELNAIGSGSEHFVFINGNKLKVDKNSVNIKNYECIMPRIYSRLFGLKAGDSVKTIKEDKYFFLKRFIKGFAGTCDTYHLAIRTADPSNHVYLLYGEEEIPENLKDRKLEWDKDIQYTFDGQTCYRVDVNGNYMYQLPVLNGKPNCEIYKDSKGNEIIRTNNLTHFLERFDGQYLQISELTHLITDLKGFILLLLNVTDKKIVNSLYTHIMDNVENAINGVTVPEIIRGNMRKRILDLESSINAVKDILDNAIIEKNIQNHEITSKFILNLVETSQETRTSFLKSLEILAARIPSQSLQSFMAMDVIGFDESGVNNAHVSRWQLWLQGSDFDIDKVSLLGACFNQGKYVIWSPYMSLKSIEHLHASEELELPTGKELEYDDSVNIWNYIEKEFNVSKYDNRIEFYYPRIDKIVTFIKNEDGTYNLIDDLDNYEISQYDRFLIENSIRHYKTNLNGSIQSLLVLSNLNNTSLGIALSRQETNQQRLEDLIDSIITEEELLAIKDRNLNINAFINKHLSELGADLNDLDALQNGDITWSKFVLKYDEKILQLKALYSFNPLVIKKFAKLLTILNRAEKIPYTESLLIELINRHNLYKDRFDAKKATINVVSSLMFNTSKDPVNYILGLVSVDATTKRVKDLANKLSSALKSKLFDTKSVTTRMQQLILTIQGKLNVGIAASSLKVFEGLSYYIYKTLNFGTPAEQEALLFQLNIGGKNYNILANAHAKYTGNVVDFPSSLGISVKEALDGVDNYEDAFLMISTFLSLAADNAKDPTLSKINAGPDMLGLYTAGVMVGIPIETLIPIIASKTGLLILEMLSGDIFNGEKGVSRVGLAIKDLKSPRINLIIPSEIGDKLLVIVNKYLVDRITFEKGKELNAYQQAINFILNAKPWIQKRIIRTLQSAIYNDVNELIEEGYIPSAIDIVQQQIKNIRNSSDYKIDKKIIKLQKSIAILKEKNSVTFAELLKSLEKELNTLIDKRNKLNEIILHYLDILIALQDGRLSEISNLEEWKEIQKRISDLNVLLNNIKIDNSLINTLLNLIKTIQEKIEQRKVIYRDYLTDSSGNLVRNVEGRKIRIIDELNTISRVSDELLVCRQLIINQGLPSNPAETLSFIRFFENIIKLAKGGSNLSDFMNLNDGSELININKWITNPIVNGKPYREICKEAYDKLKVFINPLRMIDSVEHFEGYLLSAFLSYNIGKTISLVFRTTDDVSKSLREIMPVMSNKDTIKLNKNIKNFVIHKLNESFFNTIDFTFLTSSIIVNGKIKLLNSPITLTLNTPWERANFLFYMESEYIPKLKRTRANNDLVNLLTLLKTDKTGNHETVLRYMLKETSMPRNESLMKIFLNMKKGLRNLNDSFNDNLYSHIEMLYLYNLVAFDGLSGNHNLTGVFEDLNADTTLSIISKYNDFYSNADLEGKLFLDIDFTVEELMTSIAPIVNESELTSTKYNKVWILDNETLRYVLLTREKPIDRSLLTDEELDLLEQEEDLIDNIEYEEIFDSDENDIESYSAKTIRDIIRDNPNWKGLSSYDIKDIKEVSMGNVARIQFGDISLTYEYNNIFNTATIIYKGNKIDFAALLLLVKNKFNLDITILDVIKTKLSHKFDINTNELIPLIIVDKDFTSYILKSIFNDNLYKSNIQYLLLQNMANVNPLTLDSTVRMFLELYQRFPNLDEIPGANSTKYVENMLKTFNGNITRFAKILDILDYTKKKTIEESIVYLNNKFKDLEITLTPMSELAIVNILSKPSEFNETPEIENYEIALVNNSQILGNMLYKLQNLYGINIKTTTTEELLLGINDGTLPINDASLVNAFVFNGDIYVNLDNANVDAPIHELMHIFLGSIKFTNPNLYNSLIEKIINLTTFNKLKQQYKNRTLMDIAEEILVDLFAKSLIGENSFIDDLSNANKYNLQYEVKRGLDTILEGNLSIKSLLDLNWNTSLVDLAKQVNSKIMSIEDITYGDLATIHRSLANMKLSLMENKELVEYCGV